MSIRILTGDCREVLRSLPDESVQCVVTSPPYWGLRDYGNGEGGIGLEPTIHEHMAALVEVFREVRRVLRSDGTLWLNYGDAYARDEAKGGSGPGGKNRAYLGDSYTNAVRAKQGEGGGVFSRLAETPALKAKDLMGLPWRLAFALQDDGWWLRSDIIWAKPNPMPESIKDRPTRAHEYIFLMTKAARYWYDADAIKAPISDVSAARLTQPNVLEQTGGPKDPGTGNRSHRKAIENQVAKLNKNEQTDDRRKVGFNARWDQTEKLIAGEKWLSRHEGYQAVKDALGGANARTVWNIATEPYPDAHFATFPTELAERCIKAGCPLGGTVLDPFGGAGTVGLVADRLQRNAILIELNPTYAEMARKRIQGDAPMFAEVV